MTTNEKKTAATTQQQAKTADADVAPKNVQLKKSLAGMDYAGGATALAPVQMAPGRDAKSTGAWSLAELGTAEQGGDAEKSGGEQKGPTPVGPSVEQIVQDAYTLGGKSRYQVTPQEAIKWVEDQLRNARPEHKYVFFEAIKRINKRL